MTVNGKITTTQDDAFPHGAYVVSEVEQVRDFDQLTPERFVQQLDKETGLPLWEFGIHDADPQTKKAARTINMKIAAGMSGGALFVQGLRNGPSAYACAANAGPLRQALAAAFGSEPGSDRKAAS